MQENNSNEKILVEHQWKHCFRKPIEEYRKNIGTLKISSKKDGRHLTKQFLSFLSKSKQFYESQLPKLEGKMRSYVCLGDLARYDFFCSLLVVCKMIH